MFKDQAPVASAFGFQQETHAGHRDFVVAANSSAVAENFVVYHFDGQFYGKAQCYSVYKNGAQHLEKIPCK
jgi:hypothetical protein